MITSLSNERINSARKLHLAPERRRRKQMLLEGVRLIRDALSSGVAPDQVFYVPDDTPGTHELERLVGELRNESVRCDAVSDKVLRSLADTVTPQGIVAVVKTPSLPIPPQPSLTLVLDGVSDPGNAGTLLRSAEAAGTELVVFGPGAVDALNEKVVRSGMGAHFRLPLIQLVDWRQIQSVAGPEAAWYVADASAEVVYDRVDWTRPSVVIIGNETAGPSRDALALAAGVSIPMHGPVESLNAAMAGTILLFEVARQRRRFADA